MKTVSINGLNVQIVKSNRRKTMALQIKNGQVIVRLPSFASIETAEQFVHAKSAWIQQKLAAQSLEPTEKSYNDGELFSYLGQQYSLTLIEANHATEIKIETNQIQLSGRINRLSINGIKKHLQHWYQQQAQNYLSQRIKQIASKTGLIPKSVEVKTYKARWGSCKINGEIQLNWKLIMAPPAVIDYVIIHELCHLKQHNHSPAFWQLVEHFEPDYKTHRRWLKQNGHRLSL